MVSRVERIRGQEMNRGAILFAFNSPKYDYYKMAEYAAKRINHFLDLPVTIVTDANSTSSASDYKFDNVITVEPDLSNKRDGVPWINKGRCRAFELSPYDETLLLDVDYVVNSDRLLKTFDISVDFCCHDNTAYIMQPKLSQEVLSAYSFKTLWATAIAFKKTNRAKQIFECLEMVQNNYAHYANIHSFISAVYRNDYALTLALRIANGHTYLPGDIIPWNLLHVGKNTSVYSDDKNPLNTNFTVVFDNWQRGKIRKEYLTIKDIDFHIMNKDNFVELINE
jgi:hypothetical protein